jgi:hypothetical protein
MKHETVAQWQTEPDEPNPVGFWQASCPDCGWTGHRYATLTGADEDGQCHTRRAYYEMGKRAHERGQHSAPIMNDEMVEAISDLTVGDPRVVTAMTQFQSGWTDASLFTPLP